MTLPEICSSLWEKIAREARFAGVVGRTLWSLGGLRPEGRDTFADRFEKRVDEAPDRIALLQGERRLTYRELDAAANRFARWALDAGVGKGDVVALLLGNRPEMPVAWLGLAKIGAVAALLNHNLRGRALAHCVRVSGARTLVLHAEFASLWNTAAAELETPPQALAQGGPVPGAEDLDAALPLLSEERLRADVRGELLSGDDFLYIYTSGTTGFPKAARISHLRGIAMSLGGVVALDLQPEDRHYIALPLYHSAGGVMALGGTLLSGASAVIAPKFSARTFFPDCIRYEVTVFQYIGELCRYLLTTPEHSADRGHRIRACIGNGLRPDVWEPFQQRFAIPRIVEFYGATEGNVVLMNYEGRVGSVGRAPALFRALSGLALVRYDIESDEHVRGVDGHCVACSAGEVGEAIGRISGVTRFEGYTDREASEKKILRNVFADGDAYFRTGDLLRFDEEDYFYFVDRIGDTFRWKGENVATSEVAEALSRAEGVAEANVYGVEVPGQEGRAGMAALVVDPGFDPQNLYGHVVRELPSYARPVFLRLLSEMETTGTFKHRKVDLARSGYDPRTIEDPLLLRDDEQARYVPLDAALHDMVVSGGRRI